MKKKRLDALLYHEGKQKRIFGLMKLMSFTLWAFLNLVSANCYSETTNASLSRQKVTLNNQQQKITLKGKVTDPTGEPVLGVTVRVKGTSSGTITDINGNFQFEAEPGAKTLVVSFIGMKTQEVTIGNKTTFNFKLENEDFGLDEVVVVGYGKQKKETLTGAITSISTKELVQSPVSNISNALVGRMTGITAVQTSGEPGNDGSSIKIRGIATLNAGEESDPLIIVDGIERANMNLLDPNEIETVNILKDASATAVYGVRGANGVVLITTRRGKVSKPVVSLSMNYGVNEVTRLPEFVSAYEYALLKNEGCFNDNQPLPFTESDLQKFKDGSDPVFYPNIDWMDELIKPSTQKQYNTNISGGTEKVRYFASLGYFTQNGMYNYEDFNDFNTNPKYDRYNIRANFDLDLTKDLLAAISFGSQIAQSNYPGTSAKDIFFNTFRSNPIKGPGIVDGKLITGYINDPLANSGLEERGASPLYNILSSGYRENYNSTLSSNVALTYKLDKVTKGLSLKGTMAYDSYYVHNVKRSKSIDTYKVGRDPLTNELYFVKNADEGAFSSAEEETEATRTVYFEGSINYDREFSNKAHHVTALILYNQRKQYAHNFPFSVPKGLLGLVSRITYSYKNRYMVEANAGYNGSEQFAEGKRFGFFPSMSAGWTVTEEPFFPDNKVLNYMKFRGSYGEVGNDKLGDDRFLYLPDAYNYGGGYNFGTDGVNRNFYSGSYEGKIGNPDITWEVAKKANIGVDIRMFNDKLALVGDYFSEKRNNILWELGTVPDLVAADLPAANIGKVSNSGFEVEATWREKYGRFEYWVKGNFSYAHNKIEFKDEPQSIYPWLMETGFSVGQFKGLRTDGFYNTYDDLRNRPVYDFASNDQVQRGDIRYIDVNGDGRINSDDEVPLGYSTTPEKVFGMSLGSNWRGWDFSVLFQGAANVTNRTTEHAAWPFDQGWRQAQTYHLLRWTEERYNNGEEIAYPRLNFSNAPVNGYLNSGKTDFWTTSANYIRFKNAEIGYTLNPDMLKKVGISSVRLFANGVNLYTWTNLRTFDPEAPTGRGDFYPIARTINLGANIQF